MNILILVTSAILVIIGFIGLVVSDKNIFKIIICLGVIGYVIFKMRLLLAIMSLTI